MTFQTGILAGKTRLDLKVSDLTRTQLRNIAERGCTLETLDKPASIGQARPQSLRTRGPAEQDQEHGLLPRRPNDGAAAWRDGTRKAGRVQLPQFI
jgi:hypothetical protein